MKQLTTNGNKERTSQDIERQIFALKKQVLKARNPYPISNLIVKLETELVTRKQFENLAR